MTGALEDDRKANVIQAIKDGKLNEDIVRMVEMFTMKYNFKNSKFVDGVVNPGPKSGKSLVSKLDRRYNIEDDHDFKLTDTWDIIRCSIIVDNYAQVVPLVKELQKAIPNLNGNISENNTGYKGIHLSFTINGYRAEMQIATRDAWYVKQAGEEVYSKWRDFNLAEELSNFYNMKDDEQREEKRKNIINDLELQKKQVNEFKKIFNSVYSKDDFNTYKDAVNAVLSIKSNHSNEKLPEEVVEKYGVKCDGTKSREELLEICNQFSNSAKQSQEKLIKYATNALNIAKTINKNNDLNKLLTREEKLFLLTKNTYSKVLMFQMTEKYGDEFSSLEHISMINNIANANALNLINFCKERNIEPKSQEELLEVMNEVNGCKAKNIKEMVIANSNRLEERVKKIIEQKKGVKKMTSSMIA